MAAVNSSLPAIFFTDQLERVFPTVLAYGIAGMGKTNCIRSLRPHYEPLVLASEVGNTKGMSTLGDMHIAGIMLDYLDQMVAVTAELHAKARPGELYYGGHGPFTALGLDSLTGVGAFLEAQSRIMKGVDTIWGGQLKDPRSAYPYIAEKGRQVVTKLMALPVPVILLCREGLMSEGEGDAQKTYAAPELPGQKLPRELPGWPEATLRMKMVNGHRVFVTENEGDVIARVRLPEGKRLPKYIKPNMGALVKLLQTGDASFIDELKMDTSRVPTAQQQAALARQQAAAVVATTTKQ